MQTLIKYLSHSPAAQTAAGLKAPEIIACQKSLRLNGLAAVPPDFIEFLHHFNGLIFRGAYLFGICPLGDFFLDILKENILFCLPHSPALLLGYNEYDFLAYNPELQCYQIIDKDDAEVLHSYPDAASAIKHLLKVDDDRDL